MAPSPWTCFTLVVTITITADAVQYHALLSTPEGVMFLNTSSGLTEPVIPMGHGAGGVDFHVRRREVYAIMYTSREDTNYIFRINEIGENTPLHPWCSSDSGCRQVYQKSRFRNLSWFLEAGCPRRPIGLAVDWLHDLVYWACPGHEDDAQFTIKMAPVSAAGVTEVETVSGPVRDLAVDPFTGALFFVQKANLHMISKGINSGTTNLYQLNVKGEAKMAIDIVQQMVYVEGDNQLLRIDYNLTGDTQQVATCNSCSADLPGVKVMAGQVYQLGEKNSEHSYTQLNLQTPIKYINLNFTPAAAAVTGWRLYVPCWEQDECSESCQRRHGTRCGCPEGQWIGDNGQCSVVTPVPLAATVGTEITTRRSADDKSANNNSSGSGSPEYVESTPDIPITSNSSVFPTSNTTLTQDSSLKDRVQEDIQGADAAASHLYAVYIIVITVWVGIVVVIVLARKRKKSGDFSPTNTHHNYQLDIDASSPKENN